MMEKAAELGMYRQMPFHSHTSQFGQLRSFNAFDPTQIREFLRDRYDQIKDGTFTKAWDEEQEVNNLATLEKMRDEALNSDMSKAEERTFEKLK